MKETSLGLLIPEVGDAPNGPAQIGGDAEKVDALLQRAGAQAKKCINAGPEERTNTAFGLLSTPDQVTGLIVGTDGVLNILFSALVKAGSGGRVAIFLTREGGAATQLKIASGNDSAAQTQEAAQGDGGGAVTKYGYCSTYAGGLQLGASLEGPADAEEVTTGMVAGQVRGFMALADGEAFPAGGEGKEELGASGHGVCVVDHLAAGTYTVDVRYRSKGSGTILAKNRKLRAWPKAFA